MKFLSKIFNILVAIILIPTLILVGIILWSYKTDTKLQLPSFKTQNVKSNFLLEATVESIEIPGQEGAEPLYRGYINVSKASLSIMSPSQYLAFAKKVVIGSDFQWFSVICEDGTGLYISDPSNGSASFGVLDSQGQILETYGNLTVTGNKCTYQEMK